MSEISGRREIFTVGQAAKLCGFSTGTLRKLCNSGAVDCYRLPIGGHRRITRKALLAFMKANNMPTEALNDS